MWLTTLLMLQSIIPLHKYIVHVHIYMIYDQYNFRTWFCLLCAFQGWGQFNSGIGIAGQFQLELELKLVELKMELELKTLELELELKTGIEFFAIAITALTS